MEIVSNRRLLYPALAADDPVAVRVRGNPLLDLPNLERLKKQFNSSSSEIQDRGGRPEGGGHQVAFFRMPIQKTARAAESPERV